MIYHHGEWISSSFLEDGEIQYMPTGFFKQGSSCVQINEIFFFLSHKNTSFLKKECTVFIYTENFLALSFKLCDRQKYVRLNPENLIITCISHCGIVTNYRPDEYLGISIFCLALLSISGKTNAFISKNILAMMHGIFFHSFPALENYMYVNFSSTIKKEKKPTIEYFRF